MCIKGHMFIKVRKLVLNQYSTKRIVKHKTKVPKFVIDAKKFN